MILQKRGLVHLKKMTKQVQWFQNGEVIKLTAWASFYNLQPLLCVLRIIAACEEAKRTSLPLSLEPRIRRCTEGRGNRVGGSIRWSQWVEFEFSGHQASLVECGPLLNPLIPSFLNLRSQQYTYGEEYIPK